MPTVALLAHVDTAPQFSGANVKPIVHHNHAGGDIVLPDNPAIVLSPTCSPYLKTKKGEDIINASGTTLLGADDKAGVAIVMTVARHLLENRDLPYRPVRIAFTPDEEIGRGVHRDLPEDLKADVAYTLDRGHTARQWRLGREKNKKSCLTKTNLLDSDRPSHGRSLRHLRGSEE